MPLQNNMIIRHIALLNDVNKMLIQKYVTSLLLISKPSDINKCSVNSTVKIPQRNTRTLSVLQISAGMSTWGRIIQSGNEHLRQLGNLEALHKSVY